MSKLNYGEIEKNWQEYWKERETNKTNDDFSNNRKKFYILDMFPYPSGEGLHVGHPKGYIATDVYSRLKKMQGYNVLHPMGWDAFGLPAEQFAIKNKINPNIATEKNVKRYKEQIEMLGLNYDWDREVNTTDPKFYKWTQWMWKQMYKDGLAYESFEPINWCPSCKTGLSNEDLDGNACERCGTIVEKKPLRQWVIKITDYADRLLSDIDKLNWEPHIKELQRNWIGKSIGSEIDFEVLSPALSEGKGGIPNTLKIFTTRADTLFGCTFMCISYTLAKEWIKDGWNADEKIKNFIAKLEKEEKERTVDFDMSKLEKEGVDTGIKAINPANGIEVPIYIANYILSDYGTGAIMAVPAHDERDYEFAKKYNLEIREVVAKKIREYTEGTRRVVRAGVVIVKDGKVLCEKLGHTRFNGKYLLVGGSVKEGETVEEGLLREIKEELGTEAKTFSKIGTYDVNWINNSTNIAQNTLHNIFSVDIDLEKINDYNHFDNVAMEWVPIDEFIKDCEENQKEDQAEAVKLFLEKKINLFQDEGSLINSHSFGNENVKDIVTVGEVLPDAKEVYGSSVIAYDKNKNLFLKLNNLNVNETWLASGGVNDNESYEQCALRELKEEAGISKVYKMVNLGAPIVAYYFNPNKNSNRKSFGYNYLAFVDSNQEIKSSNEAHEKYSTEWVSFGELYNSIANIKPESHHWLIALNRAKAFIDNNFDGMNSEEARVKITEKVGGKIVSKYKLKDWVFARQRYWGEPFPIVFDENRKSFAVADKELPVILPNVENYEPTDNGESPLANIKDWVEVFGFINDEGEFESVRNYIRFEDKMKEDILSNKKTNTIRLDKKNFEKDCVVSFKDQSDNIFGFGKILNIDSKKLKDLDFNDERNGTIYNSKQEQIIAFKKYYGDNINEDTEFHIISFELFNIEIKKFFRETNTMPQWAGSSWYYLRYIDPKNDNEFVDKELEKNWDPVDFYVGGAEHATRHLIYARFWHKFLFDKGFVSYDEPFNKLQTVGLIMAEDGKKMSKRYGNVVNPDDVVKEFGADAMRTYEMFMGPFEKAIAWNTKSIAGVSRFLERVYNLVEKVELEKEINDSKEIERVINETIKKVGEDIEGFKFNTAISQMMICINSFEEEIKRGNKISRKTFSDFIQILSPFAVHICEEIWQNVLGNNFSIHSSAWPTYDEAKIIKEEIEMSLQISGKFRGTFLVKNNIEDEELKQIVKDLDLYKKYILDESEIKKIIIVKNRLINIVI